MKKTIIFVEGWTDQVWVREYLLKWFGYEDVWVSCFTLFNDKGLRPVAYEYKPLTPLYYFRIVNTGTDERVNNLLAEEAFYLRNDGFDRIIGLRDMFSDVYRREITEHKVDQTAIDKIKKTQWRALQRLLKNDVSDIRLCYAIMETEAWVLGLYEFLELIDSRLTTGFILEKLNLDLQNIDPEKVIFHPSVVLSKIFELVDKKYGKHRGDIDALVNELNRRDYESFLERDKCNSFNEFHNAIHE